MLVESASLETVSTLAYVITVGIGSPVQNVFLPILGQVQVSAFVIEVLFIPRWLIRLAGDCPDANNLSRRTKSGLDGRTTQAS